MTFMLLSKHENFETLDGNECWKEILVCHLQFIFVLFFLKDEVLEKNIK